MKKIALSLFVALAATLSSVAHMPVPPTNVELDNAKSSFKWLGKKFTGEHFGTINVKSGSFAVDGGKLVGGSFVIDMASIVCDDIKEAEYNGKLVGHLKSDDFFGVAKFPTANFKIVSATVKAGNKYTITGDLTIKGTTKRISFPAYVNVNNGKVAAQATFAIDRSDFDVKFGSSTFIDGLGDKVIYDDFNVTLNLVSK